MVKDQFGQASISRRFSMCAVMQAITNQGPISRVTLSKQLGLSKQTVSEIVKQLGESGWVRETGYTQGPVGRSAVTYEIVPEAAFIVSVDLGGTKIRVSIADLACKIIGEKKESTCKEGGERLVKQIAGLCRQVAADSDIDFENVAKVVVGVPGALDQKTGFVSMAPSIHGFDQMRIGPEIEAELDIDVIVENDVNLSAVGESWAGHGTEVDDMVYVSVGTGVGAGLIVGGNLLYGADNIAGEIGYLPFGSDPFEPESLEVGALERGAGTNGICARYSDLTGKSATVPQVFDKAAAGDKHAKQTLEETAALLARVGASICAVVNPSVLVFGGSIGGRREMVDLIKEKLKMCFPKNVSVYPSKLEGKGPLIGGVMVGLTNLHSSLFAHGLSGVDITLPQPQMQAAGA